MPSTLTATSRAKAILDQVLLLYTPTHVASELGKSEATIRRWQNGQIRTPELATDRLQQMLDRAEEPTTTKGKFKFIDLFAGIGGLRLAFENIEGECVFTSEWDDYAQKTYLHNHPSSRKELDGDITKVNEVDIPDHDVLLAGFPCQPFSLAGVSKKNALGREHGFKDKTQGTLFFDVARIIKEKKPKAFLLENVKNLQSHDKGLTFKVIIETLREELEYNVQYRIIDGQHWVPQHRERIVIVGFREQTDFNLNNLIFPEKGKIKLKDILHQIDGNEPFIEHDESKYFNHHDNTVLSKYTLTDNLWIYLQNYAEKHRSAGNGFGFGLVGPDNITRTLSARYYKDGSEILIDQGRFKNPRRLTPRECARLMGYPDSFKIPVSDMRAYKQFGNSVVVPVFGFVANAMRNYII